MTFLSASCLYSFFASIFQPYWSCQPQAFEYVDFPYFINCYPFLYYSFLSFSLGLLSGFFSSISSSGISIFSISSFLIQSHETYTTPFCHRMGIFIYIFELYPFLSFHFPLFFVLWVPYTFFKCLFLVVLEAVGPGVIIDLYPNPVSLANRRG